MFQGNKNQWVLLIIFALVFLLMSIISPNKFLTMQNLQSMAFQLPEFGLYSLAMMPAILIGGINLSIVATGNLIGIVSCLGLKAMYGAGVPSVPLIAATLLIALAMAFLCGAVNGLFVANVGGAPMLVTLGTMTLFNGISLNITSGRSVANLPEVYYFWGNDSVLGIPVPMLIYLGAFAFMYLILERTPFGEKVYMVGSNRQATEYSGVSTKRVIFIIFIISAVVCCLAAVVMTSRYSSAKVNYGSSYQMRSVAAVVLGGTDINGGSGKVSGILLSTAILQVISSGFTILGIDRYFTDILMGVILIFVLTLNHFMSVARNRKFAK